SARRRRGLHAAPRTSAPRRHPLRPARPRRARRLPARAGEWRIPMQLLPREDAPASDRVPVLDEFGVLWRGDDWVALSPIAARLVSAFLAAPGRVLDRRTL